jgi:hypothetical protein
MVSWIGFPCSGAKHPLTDPSGHLAGASHSSRPSFGPPWPGERKRSSGAAQAYQPLPEVNAARKRALFLSPGQGERWHAKRDGEGVLSQGIRRHAMHEAIVSRNSDFPERRP